MNIISHSVVRGGEKKKNICGNIAEVLLFFYSRYNTYKLHLLWSAEATKPTLWLNLKDKRTERYFDFNGWLFFLFFQFMYQYIL